MTFSTNGQNKTLSRVEEQTIQKILKTQTCSKSIIRILKQSGDVASVLLHLNKPVCGAIKVIYAIYLEHH